MEPMFSLVSGMGCGLVFSTIQCWAVFICECWTDDQKLRVTERFPSVIESEKDSAEHLRTIEN